MSKRGWFWYWISAAVWVAACLLDGDLAAAILSFGIFALLGILEAVL